jgi:hypothetical protein
MLGAGDAIPADADDPPGGNPMPEYDPNPIPERSGVHPPTRRDRGALARRALAVISAPAAAGALWAVEVPLVGTRLAVQIGPSSTQVIGIGPVLGAGVVAGLAGWAALEILERRVAHPRRTWTALALLVLAASLALPLLTARGTAAAVALAGLHLAVGAAVISQLRAGAAASTRRAGRTDGVLPAGRRWSRASRAAVVIVVAAVAAGGGFVALTGVSAASGFGPPGGAPGGLLSGFAPVGWRPADPGPWGPWAGRAGGGWGAGWGRVSTRDTEEFQVASTSPAGPGSIILTGVVDAGGVEHPGRAIDSASFAGGGFRIDHSSGRPTERFDAATCVGTISQAGAFEVIDGTGRFAHLSGTGRYVFRATYTSARDAAGCNPEEMTAYIENIDGILRLTPAAAHRLAAAKP